MRYVTAVIAAACLVLVVEANATTVTARFDTVSPGLNVYLEAPMWTGGTVAGVFKFVQTGPTYWDKLPTRFNAFCIDLHDEIDWGHTYTWEVRNPEAAPIPGPGGNYITADQHLELRKLFDLFYVKDRTLFSDNTQAAAFQGAIWEIVWEGQSTHTLYFGDVKTSTYGPWPPDHNWPANARAGQMLAAVAAWSGDVATLPELAALVNTTYQDQIVFLPYGGVPPIPEPVTAAGILLGLGGLLNYVRRRRAP